MNIKILLFTTVFGKEKRLHHPLGSAASFAKNYDIKYRMGDELNEE